MTLQNLIDSSSGGVGGGNPRQVQWSNGTDSHDSGIGHSPPFDSSSSSNTNAAALSSGAHIWGDLNKAFGGLDLKEASVVASSGNNQNNQTSLMMGLNATRSSLDLGSLSRPLVTATSSNSSSNSTTSTATPPNSLGVLSGLQHRASVSSEPNGCPMDDPESTAAAELAAFSSSVAVLQEKANDEHSVTSSSEGDFLSFSNKS